jgi:hypothetical protein
MSVIKRLSNVARGTMLTWGSDDPPNDEVERELAGEPRRPTAPRAASPAAEVGPWEAKRRAVHDAFAAGVLTADERDLKLATIDADEHAPPPTKKRSL